MASVPHPQDGGYDADEEEEMLVIADDTKPVEPEPQTAIAKERLRAYELRNKKFVETVIIQQCTEELPEVHKHNKGNRRFCNKSRLLGDIIKECYLTTNPEHTRAIILSDGRFITILDSKILEYSSYAFVEAMYALIKELTSKDIDVIKRLHGMARKNNFAMKKRENNKRNASEIS